MNSTVNPSAAGEGSPGSSFGLRLTLRDRRRVREPAERRCPSNNSPRPPAPHATRDASASLRTSFLPTALKFSLAPTPNSVRAPPAEIATRLPKMLLGKALGFSLRFVRHRVDRLPPRACLPFAPATVAGPPCGRARHGAPPP